jgi:hypothetical protein
MSDVPSNLIPTRITQLPVAPVADANSLMMIVYQGNNYQIRVGDLLSVAGVPTTTQVIAGTGMTGGGQLTGNVTLSIANAGVGSTQLNTTGVASGVYGNATNIPVFTVDTNGRVTAATTVPATISGYVPTSTQVIAGNGLTGGGALNSNVTLEANYSATLPAAGFQTGSAGVANTLARSDHKHPAVDLSADDQVDNLLGLGNGGTARSLVMQPGAIIWSGADGLYVGPVGLSGQVLVSGGAGAPTWGSALLVVDQPANVVYAGPTAGAAAPTTFRSLVNADLPASGVAASTYGSTTAIPVITVNAKGVITSATTAAITGALVYQGAWNASTNTPTLASGVGVSGYYYVVSVAGSTNLDGITDWQVGDWAIFNGTAWQKVDQTNTVSSVNGQVGVVVLTQTDIAGTASLTTTQTLTNKTLTSPSINEILDANGNEILGLSTTASAVDFLTIKNGIGVSVPLHVYADGTSANVGLHIQPKGSGLVTISDGTDFNKGIRFRSSGSSASAVTLLDAVSTAGRVVTLPDATTTLVGRDTTDTLTNKTIAFGSNTFTGTLAVANGGTGVTSSTGTTNVVLSNSPTLVTPALGTPSALVGTNITGTATAFTASNVTTNANLTGAVTSVGNATSLGSFTSAQLLGALTDETGTGAAVFATSPTLVTPALGTPSALVGTNITGTASGLSIGGNAATATSATTATNLAGGAASQIPYQTSSGTTAFLANGTAGQVLTSAGASAPVWAGIDGGTF